MSFLRFFYTSLTIEIMREVKSSTMKKPINASQVPELELSLRPGTTSVNLQRRSRPKRFSLLLSLVWGLSAGVACASDPVGIYALVDKVVMERNEQARENIQIWGDFSFANANW